MDLLLILVFYFTSIISTKTDYLKDMIKKVNKNKLDLNITQDYRNITIKFKSNEYVPASGIWTSDIFKINDGDFLIEGMIIFEWLKENITDIYALNRFINTIDKRTFEHVARKENFYKKADNLELMLVIFKIEDFKKLATEGLNKLKSSSTYSSSDIHQIGVEMHKKIEELKVVYFVRYNNTANEIPSNLSDYELYILKSSNISDLFSTSALLKRCAFDIIVSVTLTFTIFGILILAGRYSLSKFF